MADKDYAPLSTACVRALNDRMYERRKAAALEIEKMVKDFVTVQNITQIKKLLKVLGSEFAKSQNPHMRKGGLIGLAAMAIGLGKDSGKYTEELISPILSCLADSDSRVRYYACESLYNVVKVLRENIIPHFNDIFSAISKLVADPDQTVKNGSELLDRLLKDIVTEKSSFEIESFIPVLRERMYAKDRSELMSKYLPEFLDPLFSILDDSSPEISTMCENQLGEFLDNIKKNPGNVDFPAMINILILHSQSNNVLLQMMAITWIQEFVSLAGMDMLPYTSGILNSVLPCLAYETENLKTVREISRGVNENLMKLIEKPSKNQVEPSKSGQLDLEDTIGVLIKQLQNSSHQSKVAPLKWFFHLFIQIPEQMFDHVSLVTPVLLQTLSDHSDEVVILDLDVLAKISSYHADPTSSTTSIHFKQFIKSLLKLFNADRVLLENKGSFIIRQLCVLLRAEDIYKSLSELLVLEDNLKFSRLMVETLSTILLTSSELFDLRTNLKELNSKESCQLFCCLYQTWSHSQIATISLCLLAGCYSHTVDLIHIVGEQEVTVEMLSELDRLIQLIESPIFTFLRMELLSGDKDLISALYGLLMLLPQSEAFRLIQNRLACVPHIEINAGKITRGRSTKYIDEIDFNSLLEHFQEISMKHHMARRKAKTSKLMAKSSA
ncbi:protein VAC14 homolog [Eurytemora carolleeae]|uniref:protein VAC14 homolog n=1 Tax=Eurytemora carolleeae TaxID=1294199 RepID=UPI000C788C3B|nr:protein VAC14 homolog [Eurytemora carolleeae]|eukprot:XP_023342024.1 protein VAC14 homolog [Eurytemora affinis]